MYPAGLMRSPILTKEKWHRFGKSPEPQEEERRKERLLMPQKLQFAWFDDDRSEQLVRRACIPPDQAGTELASALYIQ